MKGNKIIDSKTELSFPKLLAKATFNKIPKTRLTHGKKEHYNPHTGSQ